ncbi:MAG: cyclic pyranopterin monophosphate synthase [Sphaerochaeta sp.]|jgi:cyclic pyranopterin phosphate synthase|nr:cyclic pyranopterin monophosphate synthase MoaC [Spirochaetaceae bacterium]MDK2859066.1 cyclic pyranopterin monophosphate synthase [Sphaerochaeta sp.]MDN5332784.1 cyclic pyranopterin monophosphate synthase [Sphaerochaeta sp.]
MATLTHLDTHGNAIMVDVAEKAVTKRIAIASGRIVMNNEAFLAIQGGTVPKGDVLACSRIAGILAVKQTPTLIPLCHTLLITSAKLDFEFFPEVPAVQARCIVETTAKTGVEMEALTGVSVALLTIYDCCKAIDRGMVIEDVHLELKDGGTHGRYEA